MTAVKLDEFESLLTVEPIGLTDRSDTEMYQT